MYFLAFNWFESITLVIKHNKTVILVFKVVVFHVFQG